MSTIHNIRRYLLFYIALSGLIFALLACGSNTGTGTNPGTTASPRPTTPTGSATSTPSSTTPTPVPTSVKGYGASVGCPSDVVTTTPSKANVVLQESNKNTTITTHPGETVQVRLPFGQKWNEPRIALNIIELQQPAGYAEKTTNMCVWNFVAKSRGTTQIHFQGQALCPPGSMCPMYIIEMSFTVSIQ